MKHKTKSVCAIATSLITFGSLTGGANAAVTYYIQDSGNKIAISTTGGTLNLALDTVEGGGGWGEAPMTLLNSLQTGVTNTNNAENVSGTITKSLGWTNGNINFSPPSNGSWSGVSSFMMLFIDRSNDGNLYIAEGTTAGVINVGAGVFTTNSDYSIAGSGLTIGKSVTWTSNTSGDTVTYVVGAVPEPSGLALLALGAGGLLTRRRRQAA